MTVPRLGIHASRRMIYKAHVTNMSVRTVVIIALLVLIACANGSSMMSLVLEFEVWPLWYGVERVQCRILKEIGDHVVDSSLAELNRVNESICS